jgi:hypothetical protein
LNHLLAGCVFYLLSLFIFQSEITRRREQELIKVKKDLELFTVQQESSEASLRKRHQEQLNDLTDQLDQSNKQRAK